MAARMVASETENVDGESPSFEAALGDLTARAQALLTELEQFRAYLREVKQEQHVSIAYFRNTVQSELGMLERLALRVDDTSTQHIARSSNLPFLETIWNHAKRSQNLSALQKRLYYHSPMKALSQAMYRADIDKDRPKKDMGTVTIDAITDAGLTWTKVSLVTNTRLLFDLAKQGWTGTSDDEYSDDEAGGDDGDVPLVKTTKELSRAAETLRIRTRKPQIHLILPRVVLGQIFQVDAIIEKCRSAGAIVHCGDEGAADSIPETEIAFKNMAPHPLATLSPTLNIDCTILLAIVSDFSHSKVSKEPWFHNALQRQVEIEGNENLLPSLLYPALVGHKLVCTHEAAKRMREIVDTLGTPSEAARTRILMDDEGSHTQPELVQEMQKWSAYPVPAEWQLPVHVVDQNEGDCLSRLPSAAIQASAAMTPINKSVFLYGWATGHTTITSNRTVVKQIEHSLEQHRDLDENVFPSIWLCPTSRSLVGKEKRGPKKDEKKEPTWHFPDPLLREQQRLHGLDCLAKRAGHEIEDFRSNPGFDYAEVIEVKKASAKQQITRGAGEE